MTAGTIEDVKVRVEAVLGGATLRVRELSGMGAGSIIELESMAGEPIGLYAAGELVARGEVVVIDENFGIHVTALAEPGAKP